MVVFSALSSGHLLLFGLTLAASPLVSSTPVSAQSSAGTPFTLTLSQQLSGNLKGSVIYRNGLRKIQHQNNLIEDVLDLLFPHLSGRDASAPLTDAQILRMRQVVAREPHLLSSRATGNGSILNGASNYYATIQVGSPSQNFLTVVDTGSSITWVNASTKYKPSSTASNTGKAVSLTYGTGSFSGYAWTDKVAFAGAAAINQTIGIANTSSGFFFDGILGLSPTALSAGVVQGMSTVPTLVDTLKSQNVITQAVLGVYMRPLSGTQTLAQNGAMSIGGVDSSKYTGALTYFPKATTYPYNLYWGVNIFGVYFNGQQTASSSNIQAIVDTGTTLIYLATPVFQSFLSMSKGTVDSASGLPSYTTKPTANFSIVPGTSSAYSIYRLTPDQWLVPPSQYGTFGLSGAKDGPNGSPSKYYAWIGDGGNGQIATTLGQKFLENFYSVYDTPNNRIGFATRS